jgi:hypothetical protein
MKRGSLLLVAIVSAGAALLIPSAEAKSGLWITIEPARPIARSGARVYVQTDVELRREHGIRLYAVGPWRQNLGQAFFEIRFSRIARRTLMGRVRFPYAGRWLLSVPPPAASPAIAMPVRVRPPAR